jgi:glyoxylate carboligase
MVKSDPGFLGGVKRSATASFLLRDQGVREHRVLLENEGVKVIFGIPGEENLDLMDALQDSRIRFIQTRHEQGAAFMADVYGRLSGEAGVCLSTLGPGATNLITGVADAYLDRSPMVVLTGQADLGRLHKESHQHLDLVGMFRPITKWNTQIVYPSAEARGIQGRGRKIGLLTWTCRTMWPSGGRISPSSIVRGGLSC